MIYRCKFLVLSLMIASCDYCSDPSEDPLKAAHTLIERYPEGHELERAEAVDLEYRMKSLKKTLLERKVLSQEVFEKVVDPTKAAIDKQKLKEELFYDTIFAEKFCKELKKFLEENPDVRTDDHKKVQEMWSLLAERDDAEKTKKLKEKGVEIIYDGLSELFLIKREDLSSLYPVPKAPAKEATFRAMQPLPSYTQTVYPAIDPTQTPYHKIEKRKLVFKVADYQLANHNNHSLAYMFFITNQPNALINHTLTFWTLHDVEFEYEYLDTTNKELRAVFAEKICRTFMKGITQVTKSTPVVSDNRLYPNHGIRDNYTTNRTAMLDFLDPLTMTPHSFGDFSEFHSRQITRYAFEGSLAKWAYEQVYTNNFGIEQIAQALKTVTLADCL